MRKKALDQFIDISSDDKVLEKLALELTGIDRDSDEDLYMAMLIYIKIKSKNLNALLGGFINTGKDFLLVLALDMISKKENLEDFIADNELMRQINKQPLNEMLRDMLRVRKEQSELVFSLDLQFVKKGLSEVSLIANGEFLKYKMFNGDTFLLDPITGSDLSEKLGLEEIVEIYDFSDNHRILFAVKEKNRMKIFEKIGINIRKLVELDSVWRALFGKSFSDGRRQVILTKEEGTRQHLEIINISADDKITSISTNNPSYEGVGFVHNFSNENRQIMVIEKMRGIIIYEIIGEEFKELYRKVIDGYIESVVDSSFMEKKRVTVKSWQDEFTIDLSGDTGVDVSSDFEEVQAFKKIQTLSGEERTFIIKDQELIEIKNDVEDKIRHLSDFDKFIDIKDLSFNGRTILGLIEATGARVIEIFENGESKELYFHQNKTALSIGLEKIFHLKNGLIVLKGHGELAIIDLNKAIENNVVFKKERTGLIEQVIDLSYKGHKVIGVTSIHQFRIIDIDNNFEVVLDLFDSNLDIEKVINLSDGIVALVNNTNEKSIKIFNFSTGTAELIHNIPVGLNATIYFEINRKRFVAYSGKDEVQLFPVSSSPMDLSLENSMVTIGDVGGIDLTPGGLNLQTRGEGMNFNISNGQFPCLDINGDGICGELDLEMIENMDIKGFRPVIIQIVPITNLPALLLGKVPSSDKNLTKL